MKKKHPNRFKKPKVRVLIIFSVLSFFLLFSNLKANAQVNLVTIASGEMTKISIPSDFPVFVSTNDKMFDLVNFEQKTKLWKAEHLEFTNINLLPPSVSGDNKMYYVEISMSEFNKYSIERQNSIKALPLFYQLKP